MRKFSLLIVLMLIMSSFPVYAGSGTVIVDAGRTTETYKAKATPATKGPVELYYAYTGKNNKQGIIYVTGTDATDANKALKSLLDSSKISQDGIVRISPQMGLYAQKNPNDFFIKITALVPPSLTLTSGPFTMTSVGAITTSTTIMDADGKSQPWTGSTGAFRYHNDQLFFVDGVDSSGKPREVPIQVNPDIHPPYGGDIFSHLGGVVLSANGGNTWYKASGNTIIAYSSTGPDVGIFGGGGKIRIMDTNGNTIETMDADDFKRNIDAGNFGTVGTVSDAEVAQLAFAASTLRNNGAQLNGAKKVGDYFVAYASFLRDDVAVSTDGKTIIKGDFNNAFDPKMFEAGGCNSCSRYTLDKYGNLESSTKYDAAGKIDYSYTYGATAWTWSKGGTSYTFTAQQLPDGRTIIERVPGVWVDPKNENDPLNAKGEPLTGTEKDDAKKKMSEDGRGENTIEEAIEDLHDEQDATVPGQWDATLQYWRTQWLQYGVFGLVQGLFQSYQEYHGLAAYGSLFLDKEQLAARREKVKKLFCVNALIGDAECREEKLCEKYSDKTTGGNTVISVIPGAAVRAVAHIEAEKSEPAFFVNATGRYEERLFKTTFFASSPTTGNNVQIRFYYDGGAVDWYPDPVSLDKGGSISAQGNGALVKYSTKNYDKVCIIMAKGIETGTGGSDRTICAPIVPSGVTPSGEEPEVNSTEAPTVEVPTDTPSVDDEEHANPDEQAPAEPTSQPGDGF